MVNSVAAEKVVEKIQHFHYKIMQQTKDRGELPQHEGYLWKTHNSDQEQDKKSALTTSI